MRTQKYGDSTSGWLGPRARWWRACDLGQEPPKSALGIATFLFPRPCVQLRAGGRRHPHPERGSGGTRAGCSAGPIVPPALSLAASWASGAPLGSRPRPLQHPPSPPGGAGSGSHGYCHLAPAAPISVLHSASGGPVSSSATGNTHARRDARSHSSARGASLAAVRAPHPGRREVSPGFPGACARGAHPRGLPAAAGRGGGARPRAGRRGRRRWPAGTLARSPGLSPRTWPQRGAMAALGCELVWQRLLRS